MLASSASTSRPRGRRGRRRGARARRRRRALHHPAGPGGGRDDHRAPHRVRRSALAGARRSSRRRGAAPRRARAGALARRPRRASRRAGGRGPRRGRRRRAPRVPPGADAARRTSRSRPTAPTAAGVEPEPLPGGPTHAFAAALAAETGVYVHASLYEADDAGATARASTPRSSSRPTARSSRRTRKLHLPVTAGYYEDRYFRARRHRLPGRRPRSTPDFGFPTCWDQWFPEVARAVRAARRRGDRLPDRDRIRARPSRLRHRSRCGSR